MKNNFNPRNINLRLQQEKEKIRKLLLSEVVNEGIIIKKDYGFSPKIGKIKYLYGNLVIDDFQEDFSLQGLEKIYGSIFSNSNLKSINNIKYIDGCITLNYFNSVSFSMKNINYEDVIYKFCMNKNFKVKKIIRIKEYSVFYKPINLRYNEIDTETLFVIYTHQLVVLGTGMFCSKYQGWALPNLLHFYHLDLGSIDLFIFSLNYLLNKQGE